MKKLLIYERNDEYRALLSDYLTTSGYFKVLNTFNSSWNIEDDIAFYKPDIILMDIRMKDHCPGHSEYFKPNSFETIRKSDPQIKIILLSYFEDKLLYKYFPYSNGFILKRTLTEEIFTEINSKINLLNKKE